MKIIIVGDKPSLKNIDQNVPFVGTLSYKRLLHWIYKLDISVNNIIICNKDAIPINSRYVYICLGNEAHKVIKYMGVPYFKMPHPSYKNRKLNDKTYEDRKIRECKKWLLTVQKMEEHLDNNIKAS